MRIRLFAFLFTFLGLLALPGLSSAHFGMLIPSQAVLVANKKGATLKLDVAFGHPFSGQGLAMQKPQQFFVVRNGSKTSLLDTLSPVKYQGADAFAATYAIDRPGVYQFAIIPEPYFESAENCYIIQYVKTIVAAFGAEKGWNVPLGLPVEIVPLTRPFGNYVGNVFTGLVLKNGKPLANSMVEVEYANTQKKYQAPDIYLETQSVLTDANGIFTFGIPWAGWWGFAALTDAEYKINRNGRDYDVELGGLIWVNFVRPHGSSK